MLRSTRNLFSLIFALFALQLLAPGNSFAGQAQAEPPAGSDSKAVFEWLSFPDSTKFKVLGLHWFEANQPKLWRLPVTAFQTLPKGVQNGCRYPAGGRILLKCDSTSLGVSLVCSNAGSLRFLDVYVDGKYHGSAGAKGAGAAAEVVLFQGVEKKEHEIMIYLPNRQEIVIRAIGVDKGTKFGKPEHTFAAPLPIVYYGSSVCQGHGAQHAGMSYEAILARELNLDFVNLGFGGAGKAEEVVVKLVNAIPACCYVFDLGKSYGAQDMTPFKLMLEAIRKAHPDTPMLCLTPITSAREVKDESYSKRSIHDRTVMREAVEAFVKDGGRNVQLVQGEDLLGFKDHAGLSKDGVHPQDEGYALIASRLSPLIRKALNLKEGAAAR